MKRLNVSQKGCFNASISWLDMRGWMGLGFIYLYLISKKHAKKIKVLCAKLCVTNMDLSFMVFTVFGRI